MEHLHWALPVLYLISGVSNYKMKKYSFLLCYSLMAFIGLSLGQYGITIVALFSIAGMAIVDNLTRVFK